MKTLSLVFAFVIGAVPVTNLIAAVDPPTAPPIDTTITILLVADDRLSAADVTAAKSYLSNTWNGTVFKSGTLPTGIQFANNGNAILAGASVFSGDEEDQLANVRVLVEAPIIPTVTALRDFFAADVVVALTSSDLGGICGHGPQDNWLKLFPTFSATSGPHDLREANDDYIAIARITGPISCRPYIAAHEFGHLLGGGHRDSIHNFNGGLLANSKAHRVVLYPPIGNSPYDVMISALGKGPETDDCPLSSAPRCIHMSRFSDYGWGTNNYRNADALGKTARSVANYRSGPGMPVQPATCSDGIDNDGDSFVDIADSDCATCNEEYCPFVPNPPPNCDATDAPYGLVGWTLQVCVPGTSYTQYQVVWSHACPAQVSQYEVWAAQPTSNPFTYRWSVVPPYTSPIVGGASALMKVRSCGVGGCSALSSSSFLAVDQC